MIIDIHTHIFPPEIVGRRDPFFPGEPAFSLLYRDAAKSPLSSAEGLIEAMDKNGIRASVTFGFPWSHPERIRRSNDYVLESVARYPERLRGFACLNPELPDCLEEGERCLKAGLQGIGEIALYHPLSKGSWKERMSPLVRLATEWKVPVLLHINEPVGPLYPGKERIPFWEVYALIGSFPETDFILAHWGGGLWWYQLLKREVTQVFQRTYFDTAASPFLYRPEIYSHALRIIGREKVLFGSDYPLLSLDRYLKEMDQAGLTKDEQDAVLGGNSQKVLGWPTN